MLYKLGVHICFMLVMDIDVFESLKVQEAHSWLQDVIQPKIRWHSSSNSNSSTLLILFCVKCVIVSLTLISRHTMGNSKQQFHHKCHLMALGVQVHSLTSWHEYVQWCNEVHAMLHNGLQVA